MEKFINEYTLELEGRLKQAEGLLRSTLDKLYRLDFAKGSRISFLIEDLEEALKRMGKEDKDHVLENISNNSYGICNYSMSDHPYFNLV